MVGSGASLISLASLLNPDFREIGFILALLMAIGQGTAGATIYYQREKLGDDFILYVVLLIGLSLVLITGGLIQWVY
ncbi:hypothetical protein BI308_09915 [Roseofilum reptotaenium AO1-A]|uniref:Uncharacterized protein n=2 Tax=Roseofilum TaxID=1233426 RepID=A0A1L9QT05_9CYAN|nr:hypothetical protein BI308_09915 [Roseofilum reptotaenium AO1-A]